MSIDLEQIRSANPIERVIGEKFALKRMGTRYVGVEHDSLVITPQTGQYFWNSKGEYGDAFDFTGRHLLGYDHEAKDDGGRMRRTEERLRRKGKLKVGLIGRSTAR